jgi:hypothetical protein
LIEDDGILRGKFIAHSSPRKGPAAQSWFRRRGEGSHTWRL